MPERRRSTRIELRPKWLLRREIRRLREELRVREESQIPVIPVAAQDKLVRYETAPSASLIPQAASRTTINSSSITPLAFRRGTPVAGATTP